MIRPVKTEGGKKVHYGIGSSRGEQWGTPCGQSTDTFPTEGPVTCTRCLKVGQSDLLLREASAQFWSDRLAGRWPEVGEPGG